jgi:hypothetical protein
LARTVYLEIIQGQVNGINPGEYPDYFLGSEEVPPASH